MDTTEKMKRLMELVEEYMCDEGRFKVHWTLNDCHEDEWSSNRKIELMKPVTYQGAMGEPKGMHDYLALLGLTPNVAKEHVYNAYELAKRHASELGISAPKLTANEWDCWWCMAMCLADHWVTIDGNLDVASMLAYEWLSDPDRIC